MKLRRMVILGAALLMIGSLQAFGQWVPSGDLTIRGFMPEAVAIQIQDEGIILDLETAQTDVLVGTILERSNSTTGYEVTISSANDGFLAHTSLADTLAYTISYGGAAHVTVTAGGILVTDELATTDPSGDAKTIRVSHDGGDNGTDWIAAGTYEDTLTISIAAK